MAIFNFSNCLPNSKLEERQKNRSGVKVVEIAVLMLGSGGLMVHYYCLFADFPKYCSDVFSQMLSQVCSNFSRKFLQTTTGNVEAKVMCFYRRRDVSPALLDIADQLPNNSEQLKVKIQYNCLLVDFVLVLKNQDNIFGAQNRLLICLVHSLGFLVSNSCNLRSYTDMILIS